MLIAGAVAGELTEQWRIDSASWPAVEGEHVIVVRDGAVEARDAAGALAWRLEPPPGCGWLSTEADPLGVVVRGQVFDDPQRHLLGVADRRTGALLWSVRPSVSEQRAMTGMGVEEGGFHQSVWRYNDRQYLDPRTGLPITPVFPGDEVHEYPLDGGPHDTDWWPSARAVGRVGPATLVLHGDTLAAWIRPEEPLWRQPAPDGQAHGLTGTVYRVGGTLIRLDPETAAPLWGVGIEVDACSDEYGAARMTGAGILVRGCEGFSLLDPLTGARRATRKTRSIPVFVGEPAAQVRYRTGEGESAQWYADDLTPVGEPVPLPVGVQVEVLGDGLLLLGGPDAGFSYLGRQGSWAVRQGYGNVEAVGGLLAWYSADGLRLLEPASGAERWRHPDAIAVGALPGGTLIVRLSDGAIIGLR